MRLVLAFVRTQNRRLFDLFFPFTARVCLVYATFFVFLSNTRTVSGALAWRSSQAVLH